jgi:hypothetical protein
MSQPYLDPSAGGGVQVSVEQQYQQLCESWRAELDEKQRQFEQARAQILEPRWACKQTLMQTKPMHACS